jgi:hypothetical protein
MHNNGFRVIRNAWIVQDLDRAINDWLTLAGIGPFFVMRHLQKTMGIKFWFGGELQASDASAAYAQSGIYRSSLSNAILWIPSATRYRCRLCFTSSVSGQKTSNIAAARLRAVGNALQWSVSSAPKQHGSVI